MLTATTWARIGAGAFVALAIGVAALQTHDGEALVAAPLAVPAAPSDASDPLAAALERCQGATAQPTACEPVWAENRRRFLGLAQRPTPRDDSGQTASGLAR